MFQGLPNGEGRLAMEEYRKRIRKLMVAVNVMDGLYMQVSKKVGMKENVLALLYALDDGKEHSQIEICREWLFPKTTLNTIVKECVRDGYVQLLSQPGTRQKRICLTEEGKAYARRALNVIYELEKRAYDRTLEETSDDFADGMELFVTHMCEEAEKTLGVF